MPSIQACHYDAPALPLGRWKECVVYSVFGDESHEGRANRVYLIVGLFGDEDEWRKTRSAWTDLTNGEDFHAGDWWHAKRFSEYSRLCDVICNSQLIGFSVAMDMKDYDQIFESAVPQLPYYFCFGRVIEKFAEVASTCLPVDKVEFTFDRNFDVQYNATFMYDYMIKLPEWEHSELLADKVSFATRKDAGIQMADLVARETMRWLDNLATGYSRPRSRCFANLFESKKLIYHVFEKSYFESLKGRLAEFVKEGHEMTKYHEWRKSNRMQDTTENRLRFHIQLDILQRQREAKTSGKG